MVNNDVRELIAVKGLAMHQANGRTGLRFICQFCDGFISDGQDGLLVWDPEGPTVLSVHKTCNLSRGDHFAWTQELDTGLIYLLYNTRLMNADDLSEAKGRADALMRL